LLCIIKFLFFRRVIVVIDGFSFVLNEFDVLVALIIILDCVCFFIFGLFLRVRVHIIGLICLRVRLWCFDRFLWFLVLCIRFICS